VEYDPFVHVISQKTLERIERRMSLTTNPDKATLIPKNGTAEGMLELLYYLSFGEESPATIEFQVPVTVVNESEPVPNGSERRRQVILKMGKTIPYAFMAGKEYPFTLK
jgi:hypothetical protein